MPKSKTAPPPGQSAAPASTVSAPAIKKFALGGIGKKADTRSKKEYPLLPDDEGEIAPLVADILAESDQLDALTASIDLKKAELRGRASTFYFTHHHGAHEIPSSVEARDADGHSVLVAFQNRYKTVADEAPLVAVLGPERVARFFRQGFELKISGDKIPEAVADVLLTEIQELFARHRASEALTAIAAIKPTKDFHTARHSQLTPEENAAVELVCPIVAQVKTKGRGEDK